MTTTGKVQIVLAVELLRQQGAALWRRPAPLGGACCGIHISEPERLIVAADAWPPADGELCRQCEQMYQADYRRRLGQIYRLALVAAERSAGAVEAAGVAGAGTPAG